MKTYKRIDKLAASVFFVAEMIQRPITVCDVGTDHGYLAEALSKDEKVSKIFATDKSSKSLSKLQKLIDERSLEKIETFVGDGLEPIESADATVIAGIGGFETISILKNQNKTSDGNFKCRYFVLQPAQNIIELRKWLFDSKIKILKDFVFEDQGRFYPTIVVDVQKKERNKKNLFNVWLGRDNVLSDPDFRFFLCDISNSFSFVENLPKKRIYFDKVLKEKYKVFHLVEKLLKV